MKKLLFDDSDEAKKRFEFLFRALIIMGNQNGQKGLSILTRELSILDKMESISTLCECGRLVTGTEEPDRELIPNTFIELTPQEVDLLVNYIGLVPWSIGKSSRGALKVLAWIKE